MRVLVLTGFGINCEKETAGAYRSVGAQAQIVHLNEVFAGRCTIHDYQVLNLPGGFSFGDDLGSGKVLANKLKYRKLASGRCFFDELQRFLADGKCILGICNGFQALVKMGLLPNVLQQGEQEVTLTRNDSGRFENRWVRCLVDPQTPSPFFKGIDQLELPVRHGEGKLVVKDPKIAEQLKEQHLVALSYADEQGQPTAEYPANPNGAALCCAGLCDPRGQVLGMMPHPEAYLSLYNHPDWPRIRRLQPSVAQAGAGQKVFANIVNHFSQSL